MRKLSRVSLKSHLERIHAFLQERLDEIPNDCFRSDHNQALFFLKTVIPDPLWRFRVRELHLKNRPYHFAGGCRLCEWEPMGMTMDGLVDYLKDIGPYVEPPTADTEDDTSPPPPSEEDIEDDESVGENELRGSEDELKTEPVAEGDPRGEPSTV